MGNGRVYSQTLTFTKIPKKSINFGDTSNADLTAFPVGAGIYGTTVSSKNKKNNLNISLGFNTGRLKLTNSKISTQVNPFFSPKISVRPFST